MSRSWSGGSTRAHRKARALVLAANAIENDGMCTIQIPEVCTGVATQAHHTLGKAVTGDDPLYMVASCAACNGRIGEPVTSDPQPRTVTDW